MGKQRGAFKSEKRKKELMRLKKQEEKRLKRFTKNIPVETQDETIPLKEPENSNGQIS